MNVRQIISSFGRSTPRTRTALRVAMWGMTVSVAVVTVAQLIVAGFTQTIEQKLTSLISYAHIVEDNPIFVTSDMGKIDSVDLAAINDVIAPQQAVAVVEANIVAQKGATTIGLLAIGAADEQLDDESIRLSLTSARLLAVEKGDYIDVITFVDRPRRRLLRVDSIYHSGMAEVEEALAYTSIATARRLSLIDSTSLSYYRVANPTPIVPLRQVADEVGLSVQLAPDRAPHVYSWLMMIDQNMTLIFIIMTIVATINVMTAALIAIVDNIAKIGTLRALGMRVSMVRRLFFTAMSRHIAIGALLGLIVGLTLGVVQYATGFVTLDSDSYFLSEIPIAFDFTALILYTLFVLFFVVISILLPLSIISKLSIASTIKYE